MPKPFLDDLIQQLEFDITQNIPKNTIHNCISSKNLNPLHPGTKSPLDTAEEALAQICIQMCKIRQPLLLINKTNLQHDLINFEKTRKLCNEGFKYGDNEKGWWKGFKKRHGDKMVTSRGEKFAINRSDWTT